MTTIADTVDYKQFRDKILLGLVDAHGFERDYNEILGYAMEMDEGKYRSYAVMMLSHMIQNGTLRSTVWITGAK